MTNPLPEPEPPFRPLFYFRVDVDESDHGNPHMNIEFASRLTTPEMVDALVCALTAASGDIGEYLASVRAMLVVVASASAELN